MNIFMLTGSPHSRGTTALLADYFCEGAAEAGHAVARFDAAKLEVHPCIACYHCLENPGQCMYTDAMAEISPQLLQADAIVLVSPVYYFGMTAQLKKVIDRFFAINEALRQAPKKAFLLAACGDKEEWAMEALVAHYESMCRYLNWKDSSRVLAVGAYSREDVEKTDFPVQARVVGRSIR